jgi:site-specific recombinase XerC
MDPGPDSYLAQSQKEVVITSFRGSRLLTPIQKLMNHQDGKTTQIYAHLSQTHLAEAAERVRIGE